MGEAREKTDSAHGARRQRWSGVMRFWSKYWIFGAAAVLLASVAALIAVAEHQDREVYANLEMLAHVEDATHALRELDESLQSAQPATTLPFLLREYITVSARLSDAVGRRGTNNPELQERLRKAEESNRLLVDAVNRLGTDASLESRGVAQKAGRQAVEAVHDLHAALVVLLRSPSHHAVWRGLYALVAVSALLLVISTAAQVRIVRAQRQLDADLRTLMEATPQVVLSIDASGNPLRWNERLTKAVGIGAEQLRTRRVLDLFDPADIPSILHAIDQALRFGSFEFDLPLRTANGLADYTWIFSRNSDAKDSELTISGRDISDRRAAERRLAKTEARYRNLFERMRDGAFISDGDHFVEVNSALAAMFGRSQEEFLALEPAEFYESSAEHESYVAAIARDGGVSDYPLRLRHRNGSVLDCTVTASAWLDEEHRPRGFQGVLRDTTEQRRLEESLKRSEADYRGLFEHAHDAIMILDPTTEVVLDANRRACMLYDFPYEKLLGTSMLDLSVDPRRGELYRRRTLEETGKYLPFESAQYRSDGSIVDVDIKAAQVTYRGRPAILTINRDITARKREERRVRESEERFRLLLESVVDYAIFMLDPAGIVVSWNEGAERLFEIPSAEALGRSFAMFYPPDDQIAGVPATHLAQADATGRIEVEHLQTKGTGDTFDASIVLTRVFDETGHHRGYAHVIRDITERKRTEAARHELFTVIENVAQEWTGTFDAVGSPIVLLDQEGRIRRSNRAAARMASQEGKSLVGRKVKDLPGEPWKTIAACSEFYFSNGVSVESRAEDKSTGRVWQVSPTAADLGEPRLIVVTHDLTLVTELEESLRRTEMAAALGALVAGVAHEVRNPLFTISATLDTCEARLASVPELTRYTTPLREEVHRLNELMQELLDYGRPQRLQKDDISLADIARSAIAHSRMSAPRPVRIDFDCQCDRPIVHGDEGRLEQVIRNIIDNSIHHGPADEPVEVTLRDADEQIVCEVLDRGRGFSEDDLRRAFTPFYTRRRGGTGLGLAIARKIITAHGGDILLRNRDGGGAAVTIRVPRTMTLAPTPLPV